MIQNFTNNTNYYFTVLDVAQGLSTITFNNETKEAYIVDFGSAWNGARIINFLRDNQIKNVNLSVTHYDEDHFGSFAQVVKTLFEDKNIAVKKIFLPYTSKLSDYKIQKSINEVYDVLLKDSLKENKKLKNERNFSKEELSLIVDHAKKTQNIGGVYKNKENQQKYYQERVTKIQKGYPSLKNIKDYDNINIEEFLIHEYVKSFSQKKGFSYRQAVYKEYINLASKDIKNGLDENETKIKRANKFKKDLSNAIKKELLEDKTNVRKIIENIEIQEKNVDVKKMKVFSWMEDWMLQLKPSTYLNLLKTDEAKEKNLQVHDYDTENNRSLQHVLLIGKENEPQHIAYIPGDIEEKMEILVENNLNKKRKTFNPKYKEISDVMRNTEVMVLAHHGSETSNIPVFMNFINPDLALSSSYSAIHGHPSERVIELLNDKNIPYLITEDSGDVVTLFKDDKVFIKTERLNEEFSKIITRENKKIEDIKTRLLDRLSKENKISTSLTEDELYKLSKEQLIQQIEYQKFFSNIEKNINEREFFSEQTMTEIKLSHPSIEQLSIEYTNELYDLKVFEKLHKDGIELTKDLSYFKLFIKDGGVLRFSEDEEKVNEIAEFSKDEVSKRK